MSLRNIRPFIWLAHFCRFQMCELLHYFCDCELQHRIEAIVSFSDSFVSKLQYNQKFRYNELMLAFNMSAAVTAKKTKEFRSPPHEQVPHSSVYKIVWVYDERYALKAVLLFSQEGFSEQ